MCITHKCVSRSIQSICCHRRRRFFLAAAPSTNCYYIRRTVIFDRPRDTHTHKASVGFHSPLVINESALRVCLCPCGTGIDSDYYFIGASEFTHHITVIINNKWMHIVWMKHCHGTAYHVHQTWYLVLHLIRSQISRLWWSATITRTHTKLTTDGRPSVCPKRKIEFSFFSLIGCGRIRRRKIADEIIAQCSCSNCFSFHIFPLYLSIINAREKKKTSKTKRPSLSTICFQGFFSFWEDGDDDDDEY